MVRVAGANDEARAVNFLAAIKTVVETSGFPAEAFNIAIRVDQATMSLEGPYRTQGA